MNEILTSKQRLLLFVKSKRLGQNAFEKIIGISPGHLSGVKNISDKLCDKILLVYPELNIEWVQEGKGEMLRPQENQTIHDVHDVQGMFGNVKGSGHTITHNSTELVTQLQNLILENQKTMKDIVLDNNRRDDEKFLLLKNRDSHTSRSINILEKQLEKKDEHIDRILAIIEKFGEK